MIEGDITGPDIFDALLVSGTPFDLVVNCAANVKHFSRGDDILKVNYIGVQNLVGFCMAANARLVQVSTISVGGMNEGAVPVVMDEQMLFFGQNTDNQYVVSKFLAERCILEKVAEGRLDAKIIRVGNLSQAFLKVVRCHPALNSHFEMREGKVMLVPCDKEPEVGFSTIPEENLADCKARFLEPFNLSEGPLYRAEIVKAGEGLYLFTDFHHLVFDGRSMDIFMTELCAAVDGVDPSPEEYTYIAIFER